MKHKGFIDIDQPRDKVVELFEDPKNLKEHQDAFIRKEPINGKQGLVGAISKIITNMENKRWNWLKR